MGLRGEGTMGAGASMGVEGIMEALGVGAARGMRVGGEVESRRGSGGGEKCHKGRLGVGMGGGGGEGGGGEVFCRRVLSARELATVGFQSELEGVVGAGVVCGDEITGGANLTGRVMGFENSART